MGNACRKKHDLLADAQHGIASMKDCGFTTAAFVTPDLLPVCEKLKMPALVGTHGRIDWVSLSDEKIVQTVKRNGRCVEAGDPMVLGYFLTDEPGVREFPALAKAVAAVKKLAPGKLAYINLFPDYATLGASNLSQLGTANYSEYLERYVSEVKPQFISYDNYRIPFSNDLKNAKVAESYFTNLLEVRRVALEHGLPFWNIVSANQIRPQTPIPSPASLQLQAYTTLAAGAHGLTWFTYYTGGYHYAAIDPQDNRTATWSYLQMVNEQIKTLGPIMNRLASTGVFFTAPQPTANLPRLPGRLIQSLQSQTPVMIGEFAGSDGLQYVMVVNLSLEQSSKLTINAVQPSRVEVFSPADGSTTPLAADNTLWLTAGQGALLRLR